MPVIPHLTVTEMAKLFQVRPVTVRFWINQGTLRAVQIGREYYITQDEVRRFYDEKHGRT